MYSSLPIYSKAGLSVTALCFIVLCITTAVGAGLGLIPFFVGRGKGKNKLGLIGLLSCIGAGFLWGILVFILCAGARLGLYLSVLLGFLLIMTPVAVIFIILVCAGGGSSAKGGNTVVIQCLSGPLQGRSWPVAPGGVLCGRDGACTIRMPDGTPGISSRHCRVFWVDGGLMIQDMGSSYGTFLGDGSRLPAEYPAKLAVGSRFYLGNTDCMFQVTTA